MLSFNPILSQSRATQSQKKNPQLCWCSLRSQMSARKCPCNTDKLLSILVSKFLELRKYFY